MVTNEKFGESPFSGHGKLFGYGCVCIIWSKNYVTQTNSCLDIPL